MYIDHVVVVEKMRKVMAEEEEHCIQRCPDLELF